MKRMPTIKSLMTAFPYSVDTRASLADARAFMREHHIRHLPVTEGGNLVGSVSDRDINLILGPDFANPDEHSTQVSYAMVRDAYVVDMDTRLDEVLAHMAEHHLGSAIVTRHGKLAGIFTESDACRHFAEFLREQLRRAGGDDAA
ncbi:MAG: CBS domain-containing protein [Gammaproteobacteria bacterium]